MLCMCVVSCGAVLYVYTVLEIEELINGDMSISALAIMYCCSLILLVCEMVQ